MTDKDIIKALEYCTNNYGHCENCPYRENEKGIYCVRYLPQNALDLINRQQAENNRQNAEIEKLQLSKKQKLKEIERLKNECFCIANERDAYKDILDTAVTEAIKEFVDRLEEKKHSVSIGHGISEYVVSLYNIHKIKKEMVGDNNG